MGVALRKFEGQADFYRKMGEQFRLSPLEAAVFALCNAAAEEGRPLESNDDMMEALEGCGYYLSGYGGGTIPGIMKRLEGKGVIARTVFQRGRQVCILETGKSTAPPNDTSPHWRLRTEAVQSPAIHIVRQKSQPTSNLIEQEARRLGKHMTDFLADLVYIGWHRYQAEQEAGE
jgi:hypothetical protein